MAIIKMLKSPNNNMVHHLNIKTGAASCGCKTATSEIEVNLEEVTINRQIGFFLCQSCRKSKAYLMYRYNQAKEEMRAKRGR